MFSQHQGSFLAFVWSVLAQLGDGCYRSASILSGIESWWVSGEQLEQTSIRISLIFRLNYLTFDDLGSLTDPYKARDSLANDFASRAKPPTVSASLDTRN